MTLAEVVIVGGNRRYCANPSVQSEPIRETRVIRSSIILSGNMRWLDVVTNFAYLGAAAIVVDEHPAAAMVLSVLFAASLSYHVALTLRETLGGQNITVYKIERFMRNLDRAAVLATTAAVGLELWRLAHPAVVAPLIATSWIYQSRIRDIRYTMAALIVVGMIPLGTKAAAPLSVMLLGTAAAAWAEQYRDLVLYEIVHGLWHILSATAVVVALAV